MSCLLIWPLGLLAVVLHFLAQEKLKQQRVQEQEQRVQVLPKEAPIQRVRPTSGTSLEDILPNKIEETLAILSPKEFGRSWRVLEQKALMLADFWEMQGDPRLEEYQRILEKVQHRVREEAPLMLELPQRKPPEPVACTDCGRVHV